eukprot:1867557-Prymnesium_polylepis.2
MPRGLSLTQPLHLSTAAIFWGFTEAAWTNFPRGVVVTTAHLFQSQALAQMFSVSGLSAGMAGFIGLIDSTAYTFSGLGQPFDKIPWPFRVFCYPSPSRQTLVSLVYLL